MQWLWVGLGGFIGSVLRYAVTSAAASGTESGPFPKGTFIVNIVGCFLIGGLSAAAESHGPFSPGVRTFAVVGLLGGFTTFSAFGNETFELWRTGSHGAALLNAAVHLIFGLGAVGLGRFVAGKIW